MIVPFASHGCSPRYELHHFRSNWNDHGIKNPTIVFMFANTHLSWIYKPSTFFGYHHFFACHLKHLLLKNRNLNLNSSRIFIQCIRVLPEGPLFFRTAFAPLPPRPAAQDQRRCHGPHSIDGGSLWKPPRCGAFGAVDGNHLVNDGGLTWFNHILTI